MSSIVGGTGDSSFSLMSGASQNSTVSPTSFSAVGSSSMSGHIGEGNQGGSVLAHSLFSIRFQLNDCYGYDFSGLTFGGGGGQIEVSAATISLTLEGVGPRVVPFGAKTLVEGVTLQTKHEIKRPLSAQELAQLVKVRSQAHSFDGDPQGLNGYMGARADASAVSGLSATGLCE